MMSKIRYALGAATLLVVLTACATEQERATRAAEWMDRNDGDTCSKFLDWWERQSLLTYQERRVILAEMLDESKYASPEMKEAVGTFLELDRASPTRSDDAAQRIPTVGGYVEAAEALKTLCIEKGHLIVSGG